MMDKDDTTGETLILIDFDLTAYGYRWFFNRLRESPRKYDYKILEDMMLHLSWNR